MKKNTDTKQKSYAASRRRKNRIYKERNTIAKMKLKKGDNVIVVSGKDKGKTGEIVRAIPSMNRVVIDGVGMIKRAYRKTGRGQSGRIVERPSSIHASNVMLIDAESKKGTRIGRRSENGKNVRYAKKGGTSLK